MPCFAVERHNHACARRLVAGVRQMRRQDRFSMDLSKNYRIAMVES